MPSPSDNATAPKAAALGKLLFFDPRLSGDNKMSCATCHVPEKAFTDGLKTAKGAAGQSLKRNTQSVLNLGLYSVYFWDGRATSLEERALAPIRAADEMNQDPDELLRELSAVPGEEARGGWQLFRDAGCIRCHSAPALTDNKFYRLGVDYRDAGRGAITGDKHQLYAFRTPSLRDAARTAPYMHDGSF